ncbi:MAG: hypothetical protein ABI556_03670 [Gemmatimonadales bacterium]
MNCAESLAIIDHAPLEEVRAAVTETIDPHAVDDVGLSAHLRECDRCRQSASMVVQSHSALADQLAASRPQRDFGPVAKIAQRKERYRRGLIVFGIPSVVAGVVLFALLLTKLIVPEARRLLEPPPEVVIVTYPLKCLKPEQAASLLRPYLPLPKNPRWQAEAFAVVPGEFGVRAVTVRAPRSTIDDVPRLLAQFEKDFAPACPR